MSQVGTYICYANMPFLFSQVIRDTCAVMCNCPYRILSTIDQNGLRMHVISAALQFAMKSLFKKCSQIRLIQLLTNSAFKCCTTHWIFIDRVIRNKNTNCTCVWQVVGPTVHVHHTVCLRSTCDIPKLRSEIWLSLGITWPDIRDRLYNCCRPCNFTSLLKVPALSKDESKTTFKLQPLTTVNYTFEHPASGDVSFILLAAEDSFCQWY